MEPGEYFFHSTESLTYHIKSEIRLDRTSNVGSSGWGISFDTQAVVGSIIAAATVMGSAAPGVASSVTTDGSFDLDKETGMLVASLFASIGVRAGSKLWVVGGGGSVSAENPEGETVFVQELDEGNLYDNIQETTMVKVVQEFFAGPTIYPNRPVVMTVTGGPGIEGYWDPDTNTCYQTIDPKDLEINIPCMPDADSCAPELSCQECCNAAEWWLGPLAMMCGREPCWADNTVRFAEVALNHFRLASAANSTF